MLRRLLLGHRKVEEFTKKALQDTPCCKKNENDSEDSDEENDETTDYSSSDSNSQHDEEQDDEELQGFQIIEQPEREDCEKENEGTEEEIVAAKNEIKEQETDDIGEECLDNDKHKTVKNDHKNNLLDTIQSPDPNPNPPPPTPNTPNNSLNTLLEKKHHIISQLPVRKTTQRGKPPYNHVPQNHQRKSTVKQNGRRNEKKVLKYEPQLKRFSDFKQRSNYLKKETGVSKENKSGNFNVDDLENILGIKITELRDIISQAKVDKEIQEGVKGSSTVDKSKIPKVQKISMIHSRKRFPNSGEHKDETSSDSGVSEGNGEQENDNWVPERYMTKRSMVKYKEHLEKKMSQLESKMAAIVEHQKDAHFIYDLMDLYNDELKNVKRNSVGVPCVATLKQILGRQLQEMTDTEFQSKLKSLQDLRIPSFSIIRENIQKFEIKLKDCLEDDRKRRSKSVQTIRYEIGKILGMCQGLLDCVYEE